jgi:CRP/FNR family cyclic AMP-dependent transcriptional regulator
MAQASTHDALKRVPMFAELRDGDVEQIAPLLHRRRHRKNGLILLQGDKAAGLYVIAAGRVKLVVTGEDGKDLVLSTRASGDFFGELSLFDDRPLGMSILAMEDVEVLLLLKEDFHRKLRELPEIAIGLMRTLCNRLRQADMRISAAALLDVPQRVAHVLLELADEHDGSLIPQPLTHQFISQLVGASRESVSRTMSQLTQDGLISTARDTATIAERRQGEPAVLAPSSVEVKRKAIRILDRESLERAAGRTT